MREKNAVWALAHTLQKTKQIENFKINKLNVRIWLHSSVYSTVLSSVFSEHACAYWKRCSRYFLLRSFKHRPITLRKTVCSTENFMTFCEWFLAKCVYYFILGQHFAATFFRYPNDIWLICMSIGHQNFEILRDDRNVLFLPSLERWSKIRTLPSVDIKEATTCKCTFAHSHALHKQHTRKFINHVCESAIYIYVSRGANSQFARFFDCHWCKKNGGFSSVFHCLLLTLLWWREARTAEKESERKAIFTISWGRIYLHMMANLIQPKSRSRRRTISPF